VNSTLQMCDGARAPSRSSKRRARTAAVAIAATGALLLAGCGGSSPSNTATAGGGSGSSGGGGDSSAGAPPNSQGLTARALQFARCMRAHGITNFADPTNGGELTIPPGDKDSPAFRSASQACQSLMSGGAGGVGPSGEKSDMTRAQALTLAKCMRAHGVPNFPDPNASGAIPPGSVDPNSPQVKSALKACQPSRPTTAP
jgi:hypothetical protein